ncbi:hypothetical protein P8452_64334 [Trifolium repens]|nr:hypothetical protein P8452_64334 [Trifolium repens]
MASSTTTDATTTSVDQVPSTDQSSVPRKELQLVGISFMLIASRYEELLAPEVIFFLYGLLNVVGQVHSVGSSSP